MPKALTTRDRGQSEPSTISSMAMVLSGSSRWITWEGRKEDDDEVGRWDRSTEKRKANRERIKTISLRADVGQKCYVFSCFCPPFRADMHSAVGSESGLLQSHHRRKEQRTVFRKHFHGVCHLLIHHHKNMVMENKILLISTCWYQNLLRDWTALYAAAIRRPSQRVFDAGGISRVNCILENTVVELLERKDWLPYLSWRRHVDSIGVPAPQSGAGDWARLSLR